MGILGTGLLLGYLCSMHELSLHGFHSLDYDMCGSPGQGMKSARQKNEMNLPVYLIS